MNSLIKIPEDDFTLEFRTINHLNPLDIGTLLPEMLGRDGYVLQEKIIIPPRQAVQASGYSAQSIDPSRGNAPLILIGHPRLPVQYTSMILRPKQGKARVEKHEKAIKVIADDMNLLFGAPIFSEAEKTVASFSSAFGSISDVLSDCGMKETAIARTWLFLDDILSDYDLLNQSRKTFFARWHSPNHHFIPASTGIEGHVPDSRPLAIQFCAFSGKRAAIRQQASPLQDEATRYGKLFSRCVVVELVRHQLVYISGTAAIDKTGNSVHPGNLEKQLTYTLEILLAILKAVHGNFSQVVQAVVYLKRQEDFDPCLQILADSGFPCERALFQLDTAVCRDELLCEIELTAVTRRQQNRE